MQYDIPSHVGGYGSNLPICSIQGVFPNVGGLILQACYSMTQVHGVWRLLFYP